MSNIVPVKQAPLAGLAGYGGGVPGLFYLGAAGTSDADITKSLRFNEADSAYLHRTPSSASNRTTWTWSCWYKRGKIGHYNQLFNASTAVNNYTQVYIESDDTFVIASNSSAGGNRYIVSTQLLRDPSAWYHLVAVFDTTNSTQADRMRLYVNGERITDFSASSLIGQNVEGNINSTNQHSIGSVQPLGTNGRLDGYLTDVYFIDGSALDPTSFGQLDDNGVWQATGFTGGYGNNGFHLLDFANESTVGHDSSSNNNDFTAVNISTSAGGGNDVLFDVPMNGTQSDTGAGGEVSGCYATLNPLQAITNAPTNGNLEIGGTSTGTYTKSVSTIYIDPEDTTGYYCEFTVVTTGSNPAGHIQLIPQLNVTNNGKGESGGVGLGMRGSGAGNRWYMLTDQSSGTDTGVSHAANQVIGVAVKNGKLYMAINNTWVLSGNPATESNPLYSSLSGLKGFLCGTLDGSWQCNWGQRPFAYSAPSGYRPVSSASLPTPTIADGSLYFQAKTYTGNGSTQSITTTGMSPDWVWIKNRGSVENHSLSDSVRGANKQLESSRNIAETTHSNQLTSFDSSGFSLGSSSQVNQNNVGHVAWCWDAGAYSNKTYTVKVVSDSGNKYRFDDFGTSAVTLDLAEGSTYVFDQSDSSNSGHPLRFSTTSDGTHNSGYEYTTGVTTTGTPGSAGAKTTIVVAASAPTLYYYCTNHSGMGGQANTNSTAGASNFDGSRQATVKANPAAGFSIIKVSGPSSAGFQSVGHGLNAKPEFIICKDLDNARNWSVYHKDSQISDIRVLPLNQTVAAFNSGTATWDISAIDNSTFTPYFRDDYGCSFNADNIVYCFAPVAGFSSFGSYTGNGSNDGPFIYTGFRPGWLMIRRTDATSNWVIIDASRSPFNEVNDLLYAEQNLAETVNDGNNGIDFLSNGFKLRKGVGGTNANGGTLIYIAFASNPFQANGGLAR